MTTRHIHREGMTYYTPDLVPMHIFAAWDDVTNQGRPVLVAGYDEKVPAAMKQIAAGADFRLPKVVGDLAKAANALALARFAADEALAEAKRVALGALAKGMTEVDVARSLGVDRMTVRKWQGKR